MITETTRAARRRAVATAAAVLAIAALAACSSSKAGTKASQPATDSTPAVSTPAPSTPAANTLSVEAHDSASAMSFDVSGTPQAGLVTISFTNKGTYAHELGLSLTKPGVTLDQVKTALGKSEKDAQALLIDPEGEITSAGIVGPNLTEQVTVPLAAGHYIATCFLPGPDGMPHVMMGMVSDFTVAPATSDAAAPTTDGTIALTDKAITLPAGFTGDGSYTVTNTGTKPHDVSFAQLKTAGSLGAYFQCVAGSFGASTPIDKCAGTLSGGVTTLQPGTSAYVTVHLTAGHYGYVSTQGDGKDFQAGLEGEFAVS